MKLKNHEAKRARKVLIFMWFFLLEVMMKKMSTFYSALLVLFFLLVLPQNIFAHFGMLIPSDSMIMQEDNRSIRVTLSFSHPFEMVGMELEKPKRFEVVFEGEKADAPNEYMITQAIKADQNGIFTYAVPVAGWWGFSALNTPDFKLTREGEEKEVELGAVIWVFFHDWQSK
jgi:uncharacterized GH25 family protein